MEFRDFTGIGRFIGDIGDGVGHSNIGNVSPNGNQVSSLQL
jgi:hypothetical protein